MGSLDDEEESDEARGGPTDRAKQKEEATEKCGRERRVAAKGEGEGNERERERERRGAEVEKKKERMTAVELRAGLFTARTKKRNRRGERGVGQGASEWSLGHYVAVQSRLWSGLFAIIIESRCIFSERILISHFDARRGGGSSNSSSSGSYNTQYSGRRGRDLHKRIDIFEYR